MPEEGLEPTRLKRVILSHLCLPIPPLGHAGEYERCRLERQENNRVYLGADAQRVHVENVRRPSLCANPLPLKAADDQTQWLPTELNRVPDASAKMLRLTDDAPDLQDSPALHSIKIRSTHALFTVDTPKLLSHDKQGPRSR